MTERKWVNTGPGVLVLTGTDFRIEYQSHAQNRFAVIQGSRILIREAFLRTAKTTAERAQAELEEIGVG